MKLTGVIAIYVFVGTFGAEGQAAPKIKVGPVRPSEVKWTDGFWHDRFATCRNKMIPAMWELMKGTRYKPFLRAFRDCGWLRRGWVSWRQVERRGFLQVDGGGVRGASGGV